MQTGGDSLFLEIFDLYYNRIYCYIYRRFYNKEIAEDLTQETFLKAFTHFNKNKKVENFSAWIFKIATNVSIEHYRKNKNIISDEPDNQSQCELKIDFDENMIVDYIVLRKALDKLSDKERLVIELKYFEHFSYEDISGIISQKESTIRSTVSRTLKKIEDIIKGGENGEK